MTVKLSTVDTDEYAMRKSSPPRETGSAIGTNIIPWTLLKGSETGVRGSILPSGCFFFCRGSGREAFDVGKRGFGGAHDCVWV